MAVQTRAIKRRIKSVKNTRKITKAMELVAASKMRRAVSSVLGTRPYATLAWETVRAVGQASKETHPLLRPSEGKRILLVMFASDRGLAGGYNGNVIKKTLATISSWGPDAKIEAICIGRRAGDAMRRAGVNVIASFTDLSNHPAFADILPVARLILQTFSKGHCDRVVMTYTDFVSALVQKPVVFNLLPLVPPAGDAGLAEFRFEPSPTEVLNQLLPRIAETMVFQALLEASASEHAARMLAMRNASEAAGDMIDGLTFTYNQARQAGITQEIAEISSGKAALEVRV